jgi:shikimate dehydrogenase
MPLYGLIGFPLKHSASPAWYLEQFRILALKDWNYRLFPLPSAADLPALLKAESSLRGLNVTIPYKQSVIPLLNELDPLAAAIGSVNVISVTRKDDAVVTRGYNTDMAGFMETVPNEMYKEKALVLGYGGAARAVCNALESLNIQFLVISRIQKGNHFRSWDQVNAHMIRNHRFIINATPLGMFPETDAAPAIPYEHLTASHFLYDLIYYPETTAFMAQGISRNARVMNGMNMLIRQARLSLEIFLQEMQAR